MTATTDGLEQAAMCPGCRCVAAALAEVGMSASRVMCSIGRDAGVCAVGYGQGTEGLPLDEVERLCDKAIDICKWAIDPKEPIR